MKKALYAVFGILIFLIVVTRGELLNFLFSFALTGVVPGTHVVVPYWLMMAAYCSLIALIATGYIERGLKYLHQQRSESVRKARMPHRRYSHL